MNQALIKARFQAKLRRPVKADKDASWAFVVLPKEISNMLPRRGRTSIEGSINDCPFQATLEPDGQLSHWLLINRELQETAGLSVGDLVSLEIRSIEKEPEPELPSDLRDALAAVPEANAMWNKTSTIARLDWIHWISSAKEAKTRAKRINDACDMLASGKKHLCCFDPSGYYSKAFRAPEAADT